MKTYSRRLLAPFAAAALATFAASQTPDAIADAAPRVFAAALAGGVPLHDEGADPQAGRLGVWGAGDHFKIGFRDGAFVLVPYLGAAAPRSLPWQWRTVSATLGERDLRAGGEAVESFDERQFRRCRGWVTEIWDLHAACAEQRFRIDAPDALPAGELCIRGAIATPLVAAPRAAAVAPLHFRSPVGDYELVYGAATVFDAAGRSCPVPSSFDGEAITLHVPADFVATASWPLLVDPLLQPLGIVAGSSLAFGDFEVDATNGATPGTALGIVWTRSASAADSDVYVFRAASDFSGAVLFGSELAANANSVEPTVAGSWIDDTMTLAWARLGATVDQCFARSYSASSATGSLANPLLLTTTGGVRERRPRAAASKVFTSSPAQALIVRTRTANGQTQIVGSLFGTTTHNQSGTFAIATPNQFATGFTEPTVTKNIRGDYEGWIVGFQYWSTTFARHDVGLRRVDYTGQVGSQGWSIGLANPSRHAMRPRLDGSFGRYLVTFATAPTATYPGPLTSAAGTAIECRRIDWSATNGPSAPWPVQLVRTSAGRSLSADAVAVSTTNSSHWLVGTRSGGAAQVHLLGYRGATVAQHDLPGPTGAGTHVAQDVLVAYTPQTDRFAVLYDHTTSLLGAVTWTCTGIVREHPALPAPLEYGPNCGVASPRLYHDFRIGNEFPTVGQPGLLPGQWAIVGLSFASANVPFANFGVGGGCTLRIDLAPQHLLGTWLVLANSAGYAGLRVPLPEGLPPLDLYAQIVSEGAAPGTLRASRGVQIAVR